MVYLQQCFISSKVGSTTNIFKRLLSVLVIKLQESCVIDSLHVGAECWYKSITGALCLVKSNIYPTK